MKKSDPISILLVGQSGNCQDIRRALGESRFKHKLIEASNSEQAKGLLAENQVTVIVCDKDVADGTWKSILEHAHGTAERPPVVVCCRHADERLWAEVLNLGGYDVLQSEPLVYDELIRVIESAHNHCPKIKTQSA
ncbi:MAG: hypothetical protein P4L74_01105 [Candidatus Doudnabacteria bacterium]|nr:hypothetical protein [Candidatus Doudnabacteria bacterium]